MSRQYDDLIEGAKEAVAVARGEKPAARLHQNGFSYVPDEERIVAVAIKYDGLTVSKPAPARHHDVLHPLGHAVGAVIGPREQGFLTNRGRWVSRTEAAEIALKARQIETPKWPPYLYSEDLW